MEKLEITNYSLTNWIDVDAKIFFFNMTDRLIVESICGDEHCQEVTKGDEDNASGIADILPTTKEAITAMEIVIKWTESPKNIKSVRLLLLTSFKMQTNKNYSIF